MIIMAIQCDTCEATTFNLWVHPIDSAEAIAKGLKAQYIARGWTRTDIDCPIAGAGWQCPECRDAIPTPAPATPGG